MPSNNENRFERREDRVAFELHRAVAKKLIADPDQVLALVPGNVERARNHVHGGGHLWLDEWERLAASRDVDGLVRVMLGTDQRSIDMRQVGPFLGVLTEDERLAAIERATYLSGQVKLRVTVGTENGYSYAVLDGYPFAVDADTVEEALDDLVAALRDYASDWNALKGAPNHAANRDLVELVLSRSDAELRRLFDIHS